jgi:hypothetical protein
MLSRRLSCFLLITLLLPTYQVVNPQRDINAEETVAASFLRLRREAGLPAVRRNEGSTFSLAACEAASHGNPEKVWVENANYAAMIYSTVRPEDAGSISSLATRRWRPDQRFLVGACLADTPAFPSGRYWIALGVLGNTSERSVADLLSGRPISARQRGVATGQNGE